MVESFRCLLEVVLVEVDNDIGTVFVVVLSLVWIWVVERGHVEGGADSVSFVGHQKYKFVQ